jgi:tRNA(Arg) A34 adenosine deaminase TadA
VVVVIVVIAVVVVARQPRGTIGAVFRAERVYYGAGIEKKGVGDGDEILVDRRSAYQSVVRPGGRWLCRRPCRTFAKGWGLREF